MGIRLKKLELVDESQIEAMSKDDLVALAKEWRQRITQYQDLLFRVRRRVFGRKSERSKSDKPTSEQPAEPTAPRGDTTKLPSERYPEAQVQEDDVNFVAPPQCQACGATMTDSGMTEDSEYLTVKTKEFIVVQQKRHKHRCPKCHGSMVTAPAAPRVIPGGSYSDDMIVDATLSKYCDLIPMERYCEMAARGGFVGLPPHSLIQASFKLADFMTSVYQRIKDEVLRADVLLADETPHRMLEGDAKKRWFLWGFSSTTACFFECHDTRSGDVSTEILRASSCEVLLTDVYSAYKKSINEANELRAKEGRKPIKPAYCNSHARREFYPDKDNDQAGIVVDAEFMVDQYEEIYRLNTASKGLSDAGILEKRAQMKPYFETLQVQARQKIDTYSSKSSMGRAYAYFLNNFDGLTLFLSDPRVPIDNNASERLLRSHVVGRKTWYGTHSRGGAAAAAVHFSIVESCKMNRVNPRQYYLDMVDRIHLRQSPMTPSQYKEVPAFSTS